MRNLQLRTDGKAVTACKQGLVILALSLIVISRLLDWSNLTVIPISDRVTDGIFLIGCFALLILGCVEWLLSRFSPIKQLAIRKKLILFTRMFLKSEEDGKAQHSVKWSYSIKPTGNFIIKLYPNGLVKDTVDIGRKLSEYLEIDLIQYEHIRRIACYELGKHPKRYDGIDLLGEGITELHGRYTPDISYAPIPIYDNVSWNFDSEALHVLLIAPTGAGKTTITNLINRFYDIQEGKIRYDGINITKIKKDDLRRSLGIVLQDTHLFTGTIMDNIRYGKLDATDEEVYEAAKLAHADQFIKMLPKGYDTMLSGDGEELSQGQRQLLSIARAAVANPPVLILDEATSSIDTRTESIVQKGMDNLMKGRTVFVIAHRLSTIRNSDAIIVLEHGKIIERGDHADLIKMKGTYYQLYTGKLELS